ncbi:MAG: Uma2 family endonuclease [Ilumatobacteraceae bacterium]
MRTVVLGDDHPELTEWIARRRAFGQDLLDEVWDGEYHVAPASNIWHSTVEVELARVLGRLASRRGYITVGQFNLGDLGNFRVPDLGVVRSLAGPAAWVATAAMVVEIVSPHDESWLKFDHYAAHDVDEVLIADPAISALHLFILAGDGYEPAERSDVLEAALGDIHAEIHWPGAGAAAGTAPRS